MLQGKDETVASLRQALRQELAPAAHGLLDRLIELLQPQAQGASESRSAGQRAIGRNEWLSSVLDRLPIGLMLIDPRDNVVIVSNAMVRAMVGIPIVGKLPDQRHGNEVFAFDANRRLLRSDELPSVRAARGEILQQEHFLLESPTGHYDIAVSTDNIPATQEQDATAILLMQDISSMKKVEKALLASEERYRLATLATREAIWDWDLLSQEVRWNEALSTELGHPEESRFSDVNWWYDHLHPEDRQRVVANIHRAIEGFDTNWQDEYRFLKGDGTYAIVKDRGHIKRNDEGRGVRMIGAMQDVTREQEASFKLRASEADFRELTEAIPQMVFVVDLDGAFGYLNQQWFDYTGLDFDTAMNGASREAPTIHPDDVARSKEAWARSFKSGEPYQVEYRLRRHDGCYRWHLGRAILMHDDHGRPVKWLGTCTDIHDQSLLAERFEMAVSAARLGFWDFCVADQTTTWNEQLRLHFGFADGKYQGSLDEVLARVHCDDQVLVRQALEDAFARKRPYNIEFRVVKESGALHWLACQGECVYSHAGEALRMTGTALDITERKLVAQQLHGAKEEAEGASRMKSAFLANMSHEIRTPLGAILGFSELIRDRSLDDEERERYINTIHRAGTALTRIIDDILDLSKVEANKLETESVPINLHDLLEDVVDLFAEQAKLKSIYLDLAIDASLPRMVLSDPTRVHQILVNLVGNALKFTEKGGVSIEASVTEKNDHQVAVSLKVRDTGMGVAAAQRPRLFQPFSQADESTTRKHGGTGLGLALSRRLALALGGDIELEDGTTGVGAVFAFRFCAKPYLAKSATKKETAVAAPGAAQTLKGTRILLAEDAVDNQILISRILTKHGADVALAANGAEAVDMALTREFDVVLMDIQMPILDGYAATRQLREKGYQKPIIALTAHAMLEERQRTRDAGCDAHLTKPLNFAALIAHVGRFTHG